MHEEGTPELAGVAPTGGPLFHRRTCSFCYQPCNIDEVETYREVASWVSGPKLDGPKLRHQTGRIAHQACVDRAVAGQAPDQPELELSECSHEHTRPFSKDDKRPYCVSCLTIVEKE